MFAYGQTGTGKTFTMEGQFGDSSFSNMYSNAGVVPRAVEHVFKYLEENDLEYQVRVLPFGGHYAAPIAHYRDSLKLMKYMEAYCNKK